MTIKNSLIVSIIIIFIGCGQYSNKQDAATTENDTIQNPDYTKIMDGIELNEKERELTVAERDKIDSLRFAFALNDAFSIAKINSGVANFEKEYTLQPDDTSFVINIDILVGKLFNNQQKYLLIRRQVPWVTYLNIYKIVDTEAIDLIAIEQDGMMYVRDTIFDVNGDGSKDFLIHWYPSSGCCRRNAYKVYLNLQETGTFTEEYQFINPTFSAKEKIIRGVGYGHPGEVGLYKYRWNQLQIDTIEFIYPNVKNRGQFIKTKTKSYRPTQKDGLVLKAVPKEYRNIKSYEWFLNY